MELYECSKDAGKGCFSSCEMSDGIMCKSASSTKSNFMSIGTKRYILYAQTYGSSGKPGNQNDYYGIPKEIWDDPKSYCTTIVLCFLSAGSVSSKTPLSMSFVNSICHLQNKGIEVILAIGGANFSKSTYDSEWESFFNNTANNTANNIIQLMKTYKVGISIDYEPGKDTKNIYSQEFSDLIYKIYTLKNNSSLDNPLIAEVDSEPQPQSQNSFINTVPTGVNNQTYQYLLDYDCFHLLGIDSRFLPFFTIWVVPIKPTPKNAPRTSLPV